VHWTFLRTIPAILAALLPSSIQVAALRAFFGDWVGHSARIGLSLFGDIGRCTIDDGVSYRQRQFFAHIETLGIEDHSEIGGFNPAWGGRRDGFVTRTF